MYGGYLNIFGFKLLAYLKRAITFKRKLKYLPDNFGSFLIYNPMVLICRILDISVWR